MVFTMAASRTASCALGQEMQQQKPSKPTNAQTHLIILLVLGQGHGQACAMRCVRRLRKRSGDRNTMVPMPMRRKKKRTSSFAPTSCNVSESAAYCWSPLRAEAKERGESLTAATGPGPAATRSKALAENCARARMMTHCKHTAEARTRRSTNLLTAG